jgi:dual specificity MAP kinase phosphatase
LQLKELNITNILNVSVSCPKPEFINEANFLRIPVNDGHSEKILPFFELAYQFIGKIEFY